MAQQIEAIEAANGRVIGSYYGQGGTLLPIEEVSQKMDSFGWVGGYRIIDSPSMELWNANELWPSPPGIFVIRTEDMTVVVSAPTDVLAEVEALND